MSAFLGRSHTLAALSTRTTFRRGRIRISPMTTTSDTTPAGTSPAVNRAGSRPTAPTPAAGSAPANPARKGAPVSVIVVGAGAASIKLAHTLWQHGGGGGSCFRITIVEANDYVGGRVRSARFEGHTVEMGANWLSGLTVPFENPIWKLAQEIDLEGHFSDRKNPAKLHAIDCREGGNDEADGNVNVGDGVITEEYMKQSLRFEEIYDRAVEHVAAANAVDSHVDDPAVMGGLTASNDVSVRSLLELFGWPAKDDLSDVERAVEHDSLEVWATERLEELGAAHDMGAGANDVDLGKDELFVEDPRGFSAIFHGMVQDLVAGSEAAQEGDDGRTTTDILLEHEVQSISYAPGNVKVVAKDLTTGSIKELIADIVVSTVSLGVLQSGAIQFSPPLPDWKVQALNEIRMFNFGKVFVKLPKTLWPRQKDYLVLLTKGEENRGFYPFWMRYKSVSHTGNKDDIDSDLMMCYLGGAQARRVELLSEEELKDELEHLFFTAFARGEQSQLSPGDCRPVSVKVTDWSRNPRFCGSYSCFPKGAFGAVPIADLRRSLTGNDADNHTMDEQRENPTTPDPNVGNHSRPSTLYFAGEAFDDKFNGWVQGGYLSGERVGMQIIDACKWVATSSAT